MPPPLFPAPQSLQEIGCAGIPLTQNKQRLLALCPENSWSRLLSEGSTVAPRHPILPSADTLRQGSHPGTQELDPSLTVHLQSDSSRVRQRQFMGFGHRIAIDEHQCRPPI